MNLHPTIPTREEHASNVAAGFTRTEYADVVATLAAFDGAKADYDAAMAEVAAIAATVEGFCNPLYVQPVHVAGLVAVLTDDRAAFTVKSLRFGRGKDLYPLTLWRKETRQLQALTARIRKALPAAAKAA